mgnify:FL=1
MEQETIYDYKEERLQILQAEYTRLNKVMQNKIIAKKKLEELVNMFSQLYAIPVDDQIDELVI